MKKLLFLLWVLSCSVYSQNLFDEFSTYQNEDGSFGEENREVVTACVLASFTYRQYLPSNKKYGRLSKKAMKYLCARAEVLSREEIDERHLYTLWALSDAYLHTGVSQIEKSVIQLVQSMLANLKKQGSWHFEAILTKERVLPFFLAFNSFSVAEILSFDEHEMLSALIRQGQVNENYDEDFKMLFELIKSLWDLDLTITDTVKKEGVDLVISPGVLAEFIAGFNHTNSEMRKKTLEQSLLLNEKTLQKLLYEMENSAITELNLAAREIKRIKKSKPLEVKNVEVKLEINDLPLSWLYAMDSYAKLQGKREGRSFKLKLLKLFAKKEPYTAMIGFNPMTLKSIPDFLNNKKVLSSTSLKEDRLINASFGSIALDDLFYDTLKMAVKAMNKD